jgi:hypothetical protein
MAMATKTIPEYLEDERRNRADTELRTEEEAAHIQSLHHGHHRTQKPSKPELPAPVEAGAKPRKTHVTKARKPAPEARKKPSAARKTGAKAAKAIKPAATKTRKPAAAARRKPSATRKTATKTRKMA